MIAAHVILAALLQSPSRDLVAHIAAAPADVTCKTVPSPKRDVVGISYYKPNTHSSVIDPAKLKQNEANLNPIRDYLQTVTDYSDAAARGDGSAAACGLRFLAAWAAGEAMLGTVNHQGEYEREWTTGGLALAYLKIRDTGIATPQGATIDAWLARLAHALEPYYPPGGPSNNHAYWTGVAVAAAGVAANDRALFDWGIATYKLGVDQIQPDGTLPLEMAREERALHYHLFAVEPLVMLAEIGRANGLDLYGMDDGALARLAKRCVAGIQDPSFFTQHAGVTQDIKAGAKLRIDEIAWMEPYNARFPSDAMRAILAPYQPVDYSRLGGNLTQLYAHAQPIASDPPATLRPQDIATVMQRVADWQLAHPNAKRPTTDWTTGVYSVGMMSLAGISADSRFLDAMLAEGARNHWEIGPHAYFADDQTIAQTYLELYARYHERAMIAPVRAAFDDLLAHPVADPQNLTFDPFKRNKWTWCDALFMAPAAWAELSAQSGDIRYLDDMNLRFWRTVSFLYDAKQSLFYRDSTYFKQRERNGQPVFWGRGNGWVLAGIARILQVMPQNYPDRPKYVALFQALAARLASLQGSDGAWRSSLLDPNAYPEPEMSATGLITYGLAWGVNTGILDSPTYEAHITSGWSALAAHVHADGMLGDVQKIGASPKHTTTFTTDLYGTGALLLAGSEVYKLVLLRSSPHIDVTVRNPLDRYRYSETIELSGDQLRKAFTHAPLDDFMHDFVIVSGARSQIMDSQALYQASGANEDQLIFQTDIAPNETQHYLLVQRPKGLATPQPVVKTFARFVPERQDDFAWENDRIAHRVYGPALMKGEGTNNSGIDVWVKSKRGSIVDEWYRRGDYHVDHGDGLDCYDNGSSRGDGGSGVWSGNTFTVSDNFNTWQLVASGPIRAEFILRYGPWKAGNRTITESKRFTLDAGSNMTRVDDTWYTADGTNPLAVGVAVVTARWPGRKIHQHDRRDLARVDAAPSDEMGNMQTAGNGTWVEDWQQNGVPPRNTISAGATGVAVFMPASESPHVGYADGHYLLNAVATPGAALTYYFGAGWSKLDFADQTSWRNYVTEFAKRATNPLTIDTTPVL